MSTMNQVKTVLLLAALSVLLIGLGNFLMPGGQGLYIGIGIALVLNFFSYWSSDKLAIKMSKARPVTQEQAPGLYASMQKLTTSAQLPMPKLYIIPNQQLNAFATGRNPEHAAVAVTEGLLRTLSTPELEGVLAHELAHIKNRDILIGSVAAVMASALTFIAYIAMWFGGGRDRSPLGPIIALAAFILAPIAAAIIQMAISRSREYIADQTGAQIAGQPHGLASALETLGRGAKALPPMEVNQATAHMYIVNPLSGKSLAGLFSTHPPIEQRIAKLRELTL